MSETEHHRGKIKKLNKSFKEVTGVDETPNEYGDLREYFMEEFYEKLGEKIVFIDGTFYSVESENIDPYEDIQISNKQENGDITFEVRFYNGGTCLSEQIEEVIIANK